MTRFEKGSVVTVDREMKKVRLNRTMLWFLIENDENLKKLELIKMKFLQQFIKV